MKSMSNFITKLIHSIPSNTERSNKFSLYIIAFIAIIVVILGFSIKTQEKVIRLNFENNIKVISTMLAINIEDPLAGNDYSYLEKIVSNITKENTDIVYVLIQTPQDDITITNLTSSSSEDAQYLQKHFTSAAKESKKFNITTQNSAFLREYLISDIKYSQNEINKLQLRNKSLKTFNTIEKIDEQKDLIDNQIFSLEHKIFHLDNNNQNSITLLTKYNSQIKLLNKQLDILNQLTFLTRNINKYQKMLNKIPDNNILFEVRIPLKNEFGTLKVAYSPKQTDAIIGKMYFISFLTSLLFISIGIFIAFQLIIVRNTLENLVNARTKELNDSLDNLEKTNTHLFKALEHKNRFINTMSHEFRTPLNAIIGFSELLKSSYYGTLNEKQTEYVVIIKNAGDHLLSLVNDILDVVKIDTSGLSLKFENFQIKDIVEEVVTLIQSQYDEKGLELKTFCIPEKTLIIGDRTKCKQVILNILSNALKFTPSGGEVEIKCEKVDEKYIKVLIKDTGMGIEKDEIDKVFMEFYQSKYVHKKALGGTGIGLALSKKIIELHDGDIGVYSTPQKGSTFWFTLPLVKTKVIKTEVKQ